MKTKPKNSTQYLSLLAISSVVLGQLARFQLSPSIAIYFLDLILVLMLISWILFRSKLNNLKTFPWAFLIISTVSLLINSVAHGFTLKPWLYFTRWLLHASVFFTLQRPDLPNTKLVVAKTWQVTFIALAALGLAQYLLIPDLRFLYAFGWDDHLHRLTSTILDPGFTGILLVLGLISAQIKTKSWWQTILFSITLLLTYSRASYLAFFVSQITILILTKKPKFPILITMFFIIGIFMLPRPAGEGVKLERTQSISSRINSSINATDVFKSNPIYGIGFNRYSELTSNTDKINHSSAPDNSWLFILSTTGILGFMAYSYWYANTIWRYFKTNPAFAISLIAIAAHSLFNNTLFYIFIEIWIWTNLATASTSQSSQNT